MARGLNLGAALALATLLASPAVAGAPAEGLPAGLSTRVSDEAMVLVDKAGHPLYRLDLDRVIKRRREMAPVIAARCADVCDKLWRPVAAPEGFTAAGDWGVAKHSSGQSQLTYKGDPLYVFAGKSLDEAKRPITPTYMAGYAGKPLELTDGVPLWAVYWHEATYQPPAPKPVTPAGVTVKWAKTAYVFTVKDGQALYASQSNTACTAGCDGVEPLAAPLAARPVGGWKPVEDRSGQRYWSYNGRMVYAASDGAEEPSGKSWRKIEAH